jgi:NADH-quinone oxidoreductase subunit N
MLSIPFPRFEVLLPELILLGAALLIVARELIKGARSQLPSFLIAMAGTLAALAATLAGAGVTLSTFSDTVALDPFASFFKAAILSSLFLVILLSRSLLHGEREEAHAEYYGLLLLAGTGMTLLAASRELVTIFLSLELLSLSLYVLCGFFRRDIRGNEAAIKYFILGSLGTAFLLFGMSYVYGSTGSTHLSRIAVLGGDPSFAGGRGLLLGMLAMLAGFAFKIAAVPFHQWTPDVYQGAPTPVTAFMATGTKAAAFAALIRVLLQGFPLLGADWQGPLVALAVLSMTVGNLAALAQEDIKRMLAYSSIAHAGYILIGLAVAAKGDSAPGAGAALFYLLTYVFMNVGAFAVVMMLERSGGEGVTIDGFAGLSRRKPWAALAMLVFLFSLAGVPPTAGFAAKLGVFYAAASGGYWLLLVAGVLNSAVAGFYYLRPVVLMYMKPPAEGAGPVRGGAALWTAVILALAATLLLGVLPGSFLDAARAAAASLLR